MLGLSIRYLWQFEHLPLSPQTEKQKDALSPYGLETIFGSKNIQRLIFLGRKIKLFSASTYASKRF